MFSEPRNSTGTSRPWRRAVAHGVLALGLTVSGVVDACTLDALLRIPLERLLELRIDAQQLPRGPGVEPTRGPSDRRGTHVA